ncbi:hypothetical protein KTAU_32390 [Thermogemmatispora aurantia]|jgi:hypothetical protein|uniref:DUF5680 domain-containing protein n=1 Tax=Thermogemmatispora aurantia TaxID=2045279 RepID=A0A5J4KAD5_9CHLR|nr:DUF5680 domain-containing protein [Thermogemmatispora aurantia]GER84603.1 hypothetical protein KTAU_32390 [Thermogemmatispora aurantia]
MVEFEKGDFLAFLLEAKRHTYAALGDAASVRSLLPGSRQLEWRDRAWLYRDIYFGMAFFVGQEVVSWQAQPVWSMAYAGGVMEELGGQAEKVAAIYAFLRRALRQVSAELPFRGPACWEEQDWRYINRVEGNLEVFQGEEEITAAGVVLYRLRYCGGFLR